MKREKLLPCPFCGGKAKVMTVGFQNGIECKCMNIYFFDRGYNVANTNGIQEMIKRWNRRAGKEI